MAKKWSPTWAFNKLKLILATLNVKIVIGIRILISLSHAMMFKLKLKIFWITQVINRQSHAITWERR